MRANHVGDTEIYIRERGGISDIRSARRAVLTLTLMVALAACSGAGIAWWFNGQPAQGDTGTHLIPKGNMSDEEAQELVNKMAEQSRITISLAPQMLLRDDGLLRVNFVVTEPNNGLSERLELEQDGRCIYRSGVVDPGKRVEWGQAESAHVGSATATVFAVASGVDSGSPISVEVEIADEGAQD